MIKQWITRFLALSARRAIRREKPTIIAITGSFGKSSAKEAIAIALGAREPNFSIRETRKNYNNEFGVPFTVFNVHAPGKDMMKWMRVLWRAVWVGWGFGHIGAQTLILEMGADHPNDLAWLVGIAPPHLSVVTSVGQAHTEFFGTIDEVAKEKSTLVRALGKDGIAVLNNDDPRVTAMRRQFNGEAIYYGFSEGSDVQIKGTELRIHTTEEGFASPTGIVVKLCLGVHVYELQLHGTTGRSQAWAAAAALAVAKAFHVPPQDAIERLEREYHGIPGRIRIIPGIKGTWIIDDSYNAASPDTVVSALRDLFEIPTVQPQRRIAALGEMLELGSYSSGAHEAVGEEVVRCSVDILVLCGTLARAIGDRAIASGMDPSAIHWFATSDQAGRFLQDLIHPGDIILAKGSQGSRMEKIVKELMAEPLQAPFLLVRMSDEWQKIR
jgi:UDP-N-acetylmuramoyl-tripeptide--D-alanyl-D-alanine ligase